MLKLAALLGVIAFSGTSGAAPLNIAESPLFLNSAVPPLNMLVLSRDHRLYYEAYNDASDLDGDGSIDVGYKPAQITYYGYFESNRCYNYVSGIFIPGEATAANKTCTGTAQWSGDWLNYMTMSRIDALRKVLYGGLRYIDTADRTVLQRAYIPRDAHSWGKEYTSTAVDGYDIALYTPLSQPCENCRHLFASTTVAGDPNESLSANPGINGSPPPKFRVLANRRHSRIWDWVSKERPVGQNTMDNSRFGSGCTSNQEFPTYGVRTTASNGCNTTTDNRGTLTDYVVRVEVCSQGSFDPANTNCKIYSGATANNGKPTGLLQDYGETDRMYFGLLTGSYGKPHEGGVLRKIVGSIRNEIDLTTGTFNYGLTPAGVIGTIDRLRVTSFNGDQYSCGWITTSSDGAGNCSMWGNPTAEMMYEAMRYFAGKTGPTSSFHTGANNTEETSIGLSTATWDSSTNPYRSVASGGFPRCSKPFQTVISDINPSYDSDSVPGSFFTGYGGDISGMNASSLGDTIWNNEIGAAGNYFIGQSGASYDGAPTVKNVTSFGNIRGLAPEAPAKEGSYNAASVAYFGNRNDLSAATGDQKLQTFAVALASPLPKIEIPVGGRRITLVPFAKSVAWPGNSPGIAGGQGEYQPTNQIVDFYVDTLTPTFGRFRVNFEDVEQGADHDMDAIVVYEYVVNANNTVTVTLTSEYAAGGIIQHIGYVISGTTADGTYLEVRDRDTTEANDRYYFLDTKPGATPNDPNWESGSKLPLQAVRTFSPGSTTAASYLKDPLWYAAKWGGFNDENNNGRPDLPVEWDANNNGTPDNYFLVTNALTLGAQLASAFDSIEARTGSASSASVNAGSISSETRIYQAKFDSGDWSGHLLSFPVNPDGTTQPAEWDAAAQLPTPDNRVIITTNADTNAAVPFRWGNIGPTRQGELQPPLSDGLGERRLDFLRGDSTYEFQGGVGTFRNRNLTSKLGDIVSSAPVFVGRPSFFYPDNLESVPYSSFVTANASRTRMVYAGANDGMLHGFDAATGAERIAFIPSEVFANLHYLTRRGYSHRYYVDGTPTVGDVFYGGAWHTLLVGGLNRGGRSIYALDVTSPSVFSETNASTIYRWEFTDTDLGYTYSRPALVRMHNGQWAAVFGNGYNNTGTGRAYLYFVNVETGALIRKIDLAGHGDASTPNGLATPALVDLNGDSIVDYAYAGDLRGNLWKFDLTSSNPANWRSTFGTTAAPEPLYVALDGSGVPQPITSKPEVTRGPRGAGMAILFGTGKFLELTDKSPTQRQSFYGIYDPNTNTSADQFSGRALLTQQSILAQLTIGTPARRVRVTSNNVIATGNHGWYMDLLDPGSIFTGEMQVTNSVLRNGRIIFTTLIPDPDVCSAGGGSWLMEMDALTGSRLTDTPFDLNGDNQFNDEDLITIELPDGTEITSAAVSGLASDVGIAQTPGILGTPGSGSGGPGSGAREYKYLSGSDSSSGSNLQRIVENPGPNSTGRQSWRQIK
jgi:type IV pilus assembly protein PilY1